MLAGVIKWFNTNKGFGFIEPSEELGQLLTYYSLRKANIREINQG